VEQEEGPLTPTEIISSSEYKSKGKINTSSALSSYSSFPPTPPPPPPLPSSSLSSPSHYPYPTQ